MSYTLLDNYLTLVPYKVPRKLLLKKRLSKSLFLGINMALDLKRVLLSDVVVVSPGLNMPSLSLVNESLHSNILLKPS